MEKQYFNIAVGLDTSDHSRRLLVAPTEAYLQPGQVVKTVKGTYRILFESNYTQEDSELVTALRVALNMEPERITMRINEEQFEWDVHPIDKEEET